MKLVPDPSVSGRLRTDSDWDCYAWLTRKFAGKFKGNGIIPSSLVDLKFVRTMVRKESSSKSILAKIRKGKL